MEGCPNNQNERIQERRELGEFHVMPLHASASSHMNVGPKTCLETPERERPKTILDERVQLDVMNERAHHHSSGKIIGWMPKPDTHDPTIADSRVTSEEDFTVRKSAGHFVEKSALHGSSDMNLASLTSTSNVSSPLQSAYASSASLQSSHASNNSSGDGTENYYEYLPDAPLSITHVSSGASLPLNITSSASSTVAATPRQETSQSRREGPHYPDQAISVLQSQVHNPGYLHLLRSANTNTPLSQHSDLSSDLYRKPQDRTAVMAKSTANPPSQSLGLCTTQGSDGRAGGAPSKEGQYSTPLLNPTHMQPPKETHKLLKDVDPISGRKILNNYEFQFKLGSGAHGTVKLGRDLLTGELVAVKIVRRFSKKLRLGKTEDPEDKVKKEVAVLKKARHPHVVSLLEVIDDHEFGKVYLILEFVERGEIIWRKPTTKDIAVFEMNRHRREVQNHGKVDEQFEANAVAQFNKDSPQRRIENDRLLAEQSRQAKERLTHEEIIDQEEQAIVVATMADSSYWSLEHGGESEDEKKKNKNRDLLLQKEIIGGSDLSGDGHNVAPGAMETERSRPDKVPNQPESLVASTISLGHDDCPASPAIREGLVWEPVPYTTITPHNDTVFKATLDQIIVEQTPLSKEEEEFRHVPCLTLSQALDVFRDTVLGLEYLHYQGIIHRDIKPANLLWTADYRVKISDFGVSYLGRPIREDSDHVEKEEADADKLDEAIELAKTVGTPAFYAPELCDPDLFDVEKTSTRPLITGQIDVWALGVSLYGIVYGRLPFFDTNEFAMYEKIARQEVFIPSKRLKGVENNARETTNSGKRSDDILEYEEVDDELRDLLRRLLHKNPSKRITLKEVKHHPWVLRGITDHSSWIDETDPSLQSKGKKIEVSISDIHDAVVPLNIMKRIKTGMKRLGSVVARGRKRGDSNAKRGESKPDPSVGTSSKGSTGDPESRRPSLRGDEQILSALRASRENTEHPLAQNVAASSDINEAQSYFVKPTEVKYEPSPATSSSIQRPPLAERTVSTTESVRTIRAPNHSDRRNTPPIITEDLPQPTTIIGSATSSSSSISGIFGGAGLRFVRSMRSKERTKGRENASVSSRSSSIENMASSFEDSHAPPSIAMSSAMAPGHVDQPPVLRELDSVEPRSGNSSMHTPRLSRDSSAEGFKVTQEQNNRRHVREMIADAHPPRSRANTTTLQACPSSPDDEIYYARPQLPISRPGSRPGSRPASRPVSQIISQSVSQPSSRLALQLVSQPMSQPVSQPASQQVSQLPAQDPMLGISPGDQTTTSGISESFSQPSIPSIVSGASSLSTSVEKHRQRDTPDASLMSTADTITAGMTGPKGHGSGHLTHDEDEAGYNGDGDEEDDDLSEDDGGIMFGKK